MKTSENKKEKVRQILSILKKLYPEAKTVLHYTNSWELLVAVMLSAVCTDKAVNNVTRTLFKKYPNLEDYVAADPLVFEKDLSSINFYKSKARHILRTARIIQEKYQGTIPKTMDEMCRLPGIARKTSNIVLGLTYGKQPGIPVDTHVKRLSYVLGLTDHTDPIKIEKDLMNIVPKSDWLTITFRLVQYGRDYCPARNHTHALCPLAAFHR